MTLENDNTSDEHRCLECELSHAALVGDLDGVRGLLLEGADPGSESECNSALEDAIGENQVEIARLLLENGADPNRPLPSFGIPPLQRAVEKCHREMSMAFLNHGANTGCISLPKLARQSDNIERLALALECGVSVDQVTEDSERTALHEAAMYGYQESFRFLLNAGADPTLKDAWGNVPADLAKANHNNEIVKILDAV